MPNVGPLRPQGLRPVPWTPVRQAACEAIYRAVTTRDEDPTGYGIKADQPNLRDRICDIVEIAYDRSVERILMREIEGHGYIDGGWSARWPTRVGALERSHSAPPGMNRALRDPTEPLRAIVAGNNQARAHRSQLAVAAEAQEIAAPQAPNSCPKDACSSPSPTK